MCFAAFLTKFIALLSYDDCELNCQLFYSIFMGLNRFVGLPREYTLTYIDVSC